VWLPRRGTTFVRELPGPEGAPTLLLLHGWTATADLNWFACFAPLAEHFRVVALDHRGHGRGMRTDTFRLADCADDAAALVRVLGLSQVIPVGYSMGGPIAQLMWQRHPDLVAGIVLCATSCTFTGTVRERALFRAAAGASLVAGPIGLAAQSALHVFNGWRSRRGGERWWGLDEIARHDLAAIVEAGRELGRFDSRSWIGAVGVPAAVVVTDADDVVPTNRQRDLVARLVDPIVKVVRGGHAVCTTPASGFVPALVGACLAVARRPVAVAA